MPSLFGQVADAVVTELKAGSDAGEFGLTFVPERQYVLDVDAVTELEGLRVDVIAGGAKSEIYDRGASQFVVQVDVCARRRFSDADRVESGLVDPDKIDELATLLWELFEYMGHPNQQRLTDLNTAIFRPDQSEILVPYNMDLLRGHAIFLGIVRLQYAIETEFS